MRWIVLDGIDGSGKSTFASWTKEHYEAQGERVLLRIHPSPSWAGRKARRALEGRGRVMRLLATLFFIMDVLGSVRRLRREASEYGTIVYVRYLMAAAYLPRRLAPLGYDFFARLLPVPRRLLLVDVEPEMAMARILHRQHAQEMFEDVSSLRRVRGKVLALAQRGGWRVVENSGPEDQGRALLLSALAEWDASDA